MGTQKIALVRSPAVSLAIDHLCIYLTTSQENRILQVVDGPPDPAGGSRLSPLPSAHGSDSSQPKSSPAIPAAVGVSIVVLIVLITWRCLVFFRHPRRAAVLDRFGLVRRPRMFEVLPILAPHISREGLMLSHLKVSSFADVRVRPLSRCLLDSRCRSPRCPSSPMRLDQCHGGPSDRVSSQHRLTGISSSERIAKPVRTRWSTVMIVTVQPPWDRLSRWPSSSRCPWKVGGKQSSCPRIYRTSFQACTLASCVPFVSSVNFDG